VCVSLEMIDYLLPVGRENISICTVQSLVHLEAGLASPVFS
jgi:hypothetical protein